MSDNTTGNMVTLMSKDGEGFMVPETLAEQSQMICLYITEDISDMNFIPLPNVTAPTLKMVIEYCKKHVDAAAMVIEYCKKHVDAAAASSRISDEELRNWDKQFVDVDQATLYDLIMAAYHLNIKGLLDVSIQKVANMIKGKSTEEIRQIFNIKNNFTPEEEEKF
ncbi:SKP1-like protein 1B [Carex littledalei]|uniref:SKP1-like protein n=1 Tax=Carex littledalei TaxID=544730 RepID=A0A833VT23_9POAL|nr:SKP1-like protein 1B [Carex littledalei]